MLACNIDEVIFILFFKRLKRLLESWNKLFIYRETYHTIINPSRQERAYRKDSKSKDANVYVQLKIQNVRRNWLIYLLI